jgi:hypothetical protein
MRAAAAWSDRQVHGMRKFEKPECAVDPEQDHVHVLRDVEWECPRWKMQLFADGIHVWDLQVPSDILFGAPNETAVYVYLWLSRFLRFYYNVMGSARLSVRLDSGGRQTFDR